MVLQEYKSMKYGTNFLKRIVEKGDGEKNESNLGFFNEFEGKSLWFYCVVCYAKEPRLDLMLKRQPAGILKYDKSNTALFKNHCKKKNSNEYINFSSYFSEKMESEMDKDKDKEELVLKSKKTNEVMNRFLFQGKWQRAL